MDTVRGAAGVGEPFPEVEPEERWTWRLGQTAREREIGIEIGCTGSPECVAAIHIRRTRSSDPGKPPSWEEIHLTADEARWVISELSDALNYHGDAGPNYAGRHRGDDTGAPAN